ncbi:hypothetical protein JXL21_14155 [Candidatus Bathyarchaeota archaeon]|nr:hypothetical protein [Candidatus Bathyarchaeota archaeon]
MPLVERFNPLTGLLLGLTLGGMVGIYFDNFGLGVAVGASLGLLLGQWCRNRAKRRSVAAAP